MKTAGVACSVPWTQVVGGGGDEDRASQRRAETGAARPLARGPGGRGASPAAPRARPAQARAYSCRGLSAADISPCSDGAPSLRRSRRLPVRARRSRAASTRSSARTSDARDDRRGQRRRRGRGHSGRAARGRPSSSTRGRNLGFAAGCNAGAAPRRGERPRLPEPGHGRRRRRDRRARRDARRPGDRDRHGRAFCLLDAPTLLNSRGNLVHVAGFAWVGGLRRAGRDRERAARRPVRQRRRAGDPRRRRSGRSAASRTSSSSTARTRARLARPAAAACAWS